MVSIKETLDQAVTPADAAIVLTCGTVGFALDAAFNIVGVFSPGVCGGLAATGGLAGKRWFDTATAGRQKRNEEENALNSEIERAKNLELILSEKNLNPLENEVREIRRLGESNVLSAKGLKEALDKATDKYLSNLPVIEPTPRESDQT